MEDKSHILSFEGGINQDANTESVNGTYFNCENFRINSNSENLSQGLTNDIKTKAIAALPIGHVIIGTCFVRDIIILCTTKSNTQTGGQGWFYKLKINKLDNSFEYLTLIYTSPELYFSTLRPIEIFGNYESEEIIRLYCTDYYNQTRSFNIQVINNGDNIQSVSLFPNVELKAPIIQAITTSGKLEVGVYEYFVWYVTKDGKESLYSPNSIQLHIVEDLESVGNTTLYKGSTELNVADKRKTTKSVKVKVDSSTIPNNLFNKVILGCIYKTNYNASPTIIKIQEKVYSNNGLTEFIHTGFENSISTIDLETYSVNNFPFYTNKTFALKDSLLSVSNIKTDSFNLNWNTECVRYNSFLENHSSYKNPYNDETGTAYGDRPTGVYNDWYTLDQYKYQLDGVTLGGESLDGSIKYKFILETVGIEPDNTTNYYLTNPASTTPVNFNGHIVNNTSFQSYHSPFNRSKKGYKREEIYRFGLVGKKNGKSSFVKYLGDIKFPSISDTSVTDAGTTFGFTNFPVSINQSGATVMFALGIEFTINIPTSLNIDSYEIVRVPRTFEDRTRICSGVITKFYEATNLGVGTGNYYPLDQLNDIKHYYVDGTTGANLNDQVERSRRDLVSFYSPEITYNFDLPKETGNNNLKVVGIYTNTTKQSITTGGTNQVIEVGDGNNNNGFNDTFTWFSKVRATVATTQPDKEFHIEKIKEFIKLVPGYEPPVTVDNLKLRNFCTYSDIVSEPTNGTNRTAYNGTCFAIKLEATDSALFDDGNVQTIYTDYFGTQRGKLFYIDFIRFNQKQYGGIGQEAVSYNNFISITNSIDASVITTTPVFGGDIYVGQWEFMKTFWDNTNGVNDNNSFYENVVLPIESTVNFDLNTGKTLRRGSTFDHNNDGTGENYRSQEGGMFVYNSVFSSEFMSRYYFSKPIDFIENLTYDCRTYISDNKIVNEKIDSWSKFKTNNFTDADTTLGPINRTHNLANNLFLLQDNGISYLPINERAITTSTDGAPTILGTAEGFSEHVYISKTTGSMHQWGSIVVENMLLFYDSYRHKFQRLNGTSPENLSVIKGMNSFFQNVGFNCNLRKEEGGDNPIINKGVHLGYNQKHEELFITFLGNNRDVEKNNKTVVLNMRYDNFRGFYSHTPNIYLNDYSNIYSPSVSDLSRIHIYNEGNNGVIFGELKESVIEFIINNEPTLTKILRCIQYDVIAKDTNGNLLNEGLTSIRISNEYQDTGKVSLLNRQKNRFNTWKIWKIPRNTLVPNRISRIRNDWFKVSLYFQNESNKQINLERIFSIYQTQPK